MACLCPVAFWWPSRQARPSLVPYRGQLDTEQGSRALIWHDTQVSTSEVLVLPPSSPACAYSTYFGTA